MKMTTTITTEKAKFQYTLEAPEGPLTGYRYTIIFADGTYAHVRIVCDREWPAFVEVFVRIEPGPWLAMDRTRFAGARESFYRDEEEFERALGLSLGFDENVDEEEGALLSGRLISLALDEYARRHPAIVKSVPPRETPTEALPVVAALTGTDEHTDAND